MTDQFVPRPVVNPSKRQAREALHEIAKTYPTLMGLLMRKASDSQTVGDRWAELLVAADLNVDFMVNVCDDYADGKLDIPQPSDTLCREIIKEAHQRQRELDYKDKANWSRTLARRTPGVHDWDNDNHTDRFIAAMRISISKALTPEEIKELQQYSERDGPVPSFMEVASEEEA